MSGNYNGVFNLDGKSAARPTLEILNFTVHTGCTLEVGRNCASRSKLQNQIPSQVSDIKHIISVTGEFGKDFEPREVKVYLS